VIVIFRLYFKPENHPVKGAVYFRPRPPLWECGSGVSGYEGVVSGFCERQTTECEARKGEELRAFVFVTLFRSRPKVFQGGIVHLEGSLSVE